MLEIGGTLRKARSRAGLELSDVESATMIPARFLEALEKEQFDRLPAGLYRRSFLREYADFLGLDGETYAREHELRITPPDPDQPPEPVSHGAAVFVARLLELYTPGRAVAVCLAGLAAIAVWQLGGDPSHTGVVKRPAPSVRKQASLGLPRTVTTPATAMTTRPATSAAPSPLTLSAVHGNSWLLVRIASSRGRIVFDHTLEQGDTARFGLQQRLFISLGAPWNLDASIGRRSVTATLPDTTASMIASRHGLTETTDNTPAATANRAAGTLTPTTLVEQTHAVALNTRGYRLMLRGDYIGALPLLRAAVDGLDDPANPVTFYANFNLGQTLVELGRCSSAIPYLTHAAELQPTSRPATDALTNASKC